MKQLLSDNEIEIRIKELLHKNSSFNADDLTVTSDHGIVTLSGTVKNDKEKLGATSIAQKIPDVRQVKNEIIVKINEGILPTDIGRNDEESGRASQI